jgi:hypothetical protein
VDVRHLVVSFALVGSGCSEHASSPIASSVVVLPVTLGDASPAGCDPRCPGPECPLTSGAPILLATSDRTMGGLAVDATNVYFATVQGDIQACGVHGCACAPRVLVAHHGDLALAIDANDVYWAEQSTGDVAKCPLAGCDAPSIIGNAGGQPEVVALDANDVYWDGLFESALHSCPLSGCTGAPRELLPDTVPAIANVIVVNGPDIFWSAMGDVETCPTTGCASPTLIVPPSHAARPVSIAVDANDVYWADDALAGIWRCSRADCTSTKAVFAADGSGPMAIDDESVYFAKQEGFFRCPRTGCSDGETFVAQTNTSALRLVVGADALYWTTVDGLWMAAKR